MRLSTIKATIVLILKTKGNTHIKMKPPPNTYNLLTKVNVVSQLNPKVPSEFHE